MRQAEAARDQGIDSGPPGQRRVACSSGTVRCSGVWFLARGEGCTLLVTGEVTPTIVAVPYASLLPRGTHGFSSCSPIVKARRVRLQDPSEQITLPSRSPDRRARRTLWREEKSISPNARAVAVRSHSSSVTAAWPQESCGPRTPRPRPTARQRCPRRSDARTSAQRRIGSTKRHAMATALALLRRPRALP